MELDALVKSLEGLVAKASETPAVDVAAVVDEKIATLKTELTALIEASVAPVMKAFADASREGVGRKGVVEGASAEKSFEEAPVDFVVKKASAVAKGEAEYTPDEKAAVVEMFKMYFSDGLSE